MSKTTDEMAILTNVAMVLDITGAEVDELARGLGALTLGRYLNVIQNAARRPGGAGDLETDIKQLAATLGDDVSFAWIKANKRKKRAETP